MPASASALIVGAMALVFAQVLNPATARNQSLIAMLEVAGDRPDRWLAMGVLFFLGAAGLTLGLPCVLSLFTRRRGQRLGFAAVGVLCLGCIGLAGYSAAMLMLRALALSGDLTPRQLNGILDDTGLAGMLGFWAYGFLLGVLLVAVALFRAQATAGWVPALLVAFLALQLLATEGGRVFTAVGLIALAAGMTGIAMTATGLDRPA